MSQTCNFGYCSVCFENNVAIWMIDCGHIFCIQCILTWYNVNKNHTIPAMCFLRCNAFISEDTVKEIGYNTTDPALLALIPANLLPPQDPRTIDFNAIFFQEPVAIPISFR